MQTAPLKGVPVVLHAAGSSGAARGKVLAIPDSFRRHKITIIGSAGISAGAIQPETAETYNYSGTWAPIGGGPVLASASSSLIIEFEGIYRFLAARISTAIGSGTVEVIYEGS